MYNLDIHAFVISCLHILHATAVLNVIGCYSGEKPNKRQLLSFQSLFA